jgi:acyl dehydratase
VSVEAGPESYTRPDLQPLSFEELPLGGEWTTRGRTITEADIALFSGITYDLSPHALADATHGVRFGPPTLVIAAAIGLGSVDTPVADVAEWGWTTWKFPNAVRAGDTISARWTLTQKRPPFPASTVGTVVWRVDVFKGDGTLCAEGEIGASVRRKLLGVTRAVPAAQEASVPRSRSRRRRRSPAGVAATPKPSVEAPPAAVAAAPETTATIDRPPSRGRRRRRRPSGAHKNGEPALAPTPEVVHISVETPAPAPKSQPAEPANPLRGIIKRIRGS